ncbi:uncharacterized protein [Littorina saxatilis]|uniref:uncharacterized protein isoform X1 n=2 Tax=Littorina saxatilis TaxID=31220 RepID=UPI0038B44961
MKDPAMYRGTRRPQSSPVVLQRRLTLDDFPMEHGFKDAQQRSVSSRQERLRLQDRLQSARQESETLRDYSRRRFQTVVELESKLRPQPPPAPQRTQRIPPPLSRPMTTGGSHRPYPYPLTPSTPTNGPTQLGSILYNGEHLQLSSMRTRPQSEPPSRFDHLRGTYVNYPYIQRVLEQSNCDYRLVSSPCHTAREEGYRVKDSFDPTDFVMLVPVTRDDVRDHVTVRQKTEAWAEEDGPLLASTARSRSPMSGGSQKNVEERGELEGDR